MLRRLSTIATAPPPSPMPSAAPAAPARASGPQPPTWHELSQRLTEHLQATLAQGSGVGAAGAMPGTDPTADRQRGLVPATTPGSGPTPAG